MSVFAVQAKNFMIRTVRCDKSGGLQTLSVFLNEVGDQEDHDSLLDRLSRRMKGSCDRKYHADEYHFLDSKNVPFDSRLEEFSQFCKKNRALLLLVGKLRRKRVVKKTEKTDAACTVCGIQ